MKKYLCTVLFIFCISVNIYSEDDGKEGIAELLKKQDYCHVYFGLNGSWDTYLGEDANSSFKMNRVNLQVRGNINDWLSYNYRQRLNRSNDGRGRFDNLPASIDIAGIGIKLDQKFSLFAGKQFISYGGFEFDLNPIEVYQYSEIGDNLIAFSTGVNLAYQINKDHQLNFQILNGRNESTEATYGVGFEDAKLPFMYTLNWNGSFSDVYNSRFSGTIINQTKGKYLYYFALGNQLKFGKFSTYFDWMYSNEAVDFQGTLSSMINGNEGKSNSLNARYLSSVLNIRYQLSDKWNVVLEGIYNTTGKYKDGEFAEKGKYRTTYTYIGVLEYYPMEKSNFHFFANYIGNSFRYTDRAKALGNSNSETNRVSVGFIYQLPVF